MKNFGIRRHKGRRQDKIPVQASFILGKWRAFKDENHKWYLLRYTGQTTVLGNTLRSKECPHCKMSRNECHHCKKERNALIVKCLESITGWKQDSGRSKRILDNGPGTRFQGLLGQQGREWGFPASGVRRDMRMAR